MEKIILLALTAIYKKVVGRTLFNGNTYYWGRGGCCILALTVLMMVGCYNQNDVAKSVEEGDFGVTVYDSCEYLIRSSGYKGYLAHKGNCRFCKERRQKELEELVIKFKEK